MFKKLTIILTLLVFIFTLSGCNKTGDGNTTSTDTTTVEDPSLTMTELVKNSVALYKIIRAEDANDTIISNIQKLKTQLDKKTGASFELGIDWFREGDTTITDKLEILVGQTNRPEYETALSQLKYNDYSITKIGNKIVIAAHTEQNISIAVNYFIKYISDCITTNTEDKTDVIIAQDWFYTFSASYDFTDILLGSTSIKDYKIIVAESPRAGDLNVAQMIQGALAQRCGFVIPITNDKNPQSDNEIIIGRTTRAESSAYYNETPNALNYIIKTEGSKIIIGFGGYTSSLGAVEEFNKVLDLNKSGDMVVLNNNLNVNTTLSPDYLPPTELANGAGLRIMSTNVLFDKVSIPLRAEIFEDYYRIFKPDTIGLQEMIKDWQNALFPLVSDLYAVCNPMPSDGVPNYTPILYLKDKYNLIESGVKRFRTGRNPWLVTWAVFEDKQTGQKFIHCNTHYTVVTDSDKAAHPEYTSATAIQWRLEDCAVVKAKVLELQAKYNGIPAVITGDFNSNQFSQEYGLMKTDTDIRTSMLVATVSSMKDYRSYHTLGVADRGPNDGNAIDHVMVTENTIDVYVHKIIYDNIIVHASDHCPVYADISFK